MAKYLDFETALQRLIREYKEHGKLIVAYDFDDTVCTYTLGNPEPTLERVANEEICQLLRDLRPYAEFIVWTCRSMTHQEKGEPDVALALAVRWLDNHNVPRDYVNTDGPVTYGSRKIYSNILLDDRAGLETAYNLLVAFLKWVKEENIEKTGEVQEVKENREPKGNRGKRGKRDV